VTKVVIIFTTPIYPCNWYFGNDHKEVGLYAGKPVENAAYCFKKTISNSNWTEWSTIQGVIGRVISKSAEHEARGRFEITSPITLWIVRHKVQLLINHNYNKIREEYE